MLCRRGLGLCIHLSYVRYNDLTSNLKYNTPLEGQGVHPGARALSKEGPGLNASRMVVLVVNRVHHGATL